MKTELHNCYICAEGQSCISSVVGGSVSVSPYGPMLLDSVGLLVVSLTFLAPTILPLNHLHDSHKLSLIELCVSASVSISCWVKPL